jgi:nucleoside-diphosphate-sugar epimerase
VTDRVVLVTGAAGKVGAATCKLLQANGWRVRALCHRRTPPVYDELADASLDTGAGLAAASNGVDAILHLAAITHARRSAMYRSVNADGTAELVEAARGAGVDRLVFVSTRAISPDGGAYSRSKAEAERIVSASGVPHAIVRLPEVYGAGGTEGVDGIIERAQSNRWIPLPAADVAQICPVYLDDVLPPLIRALETPKALGKTYTLAGECLSLRAFAQACIETFQSTSSIVAIPPSGIRALCALSRILPLPIYPDQLTRLLSEKPLRTAGADDDLDFTPRPLIQGLSSLRVPPQSSANSDV